MSDQVPFGKYKGRPVEEMLSDASYMAWLEAQPWFRERFGHLKTAKDTDAMSRTPVHNKLQTLFLDRRYQTAFVICADPDWVMDMGSRAKSTQASTVRTINKILAERPQRIEEMKAPGYRTTLEQKWISDERHAARIASMEESIPFFADLLSRVAADKHALQSSAAFESAGADVLLTVGLVYLKVWNEGYNPISDELDVSKIHCERDADMGRPFSIEIKPTVADEYPAVLRQMNRNKSEFLFVGQYTGEGATESQFVQIFAASGKKVVFKRDVDARLK